MDFDEIVVKGSPGLCRCCLSEGCYKDLSSEYAWMNDTEIYADMLLECFDISISQHVEGPNGSSRLICEVCITRLRDACNFKKQVLDSEKKFVDMVGRGEFRSKVVVFQAQMKTEPAAQEAAEESVAEVEYLEDIDYGDDDDTLKDEPTVSDIMVSQLPEVTVKRTRGKKTTIVKPKKAKEEKPKTSKAAVKDGKIRKEWTIPTTKFEDSQLLSLFSNSSVIPFTWNGQFMCSYCHAPCGVHEDIVNHMKYHDDDTIQLWINTLNPAELVKLDISVIDCKMCSTTCDSVEAMLDHFMFEHDVKIYPTKNQMMNVELYNVEERRCMLCRDEFATVKEVLLHWRNCHPIIGNHKSMFSKPPSKKEINNDKLEIKQVRKLIAIILNTSNAIPFKFYAGKFRCFYCNELFTRFDVLKKHTTTKHPSCDDKAKYMAKLKGDKDIVVKLETTSLSCKLCSEPLSDIKALEKHIVAEHKVQYDSSIRHLILAFKIKEDNSTTCPLCPKTFRYVIRCLEHINVSHTEINNFVCEHCGRKFRNHYVYRSHMTRYHKDHTCPECGKVFTSLSKIRVHRAREHDVKDFKCSDCDMMFKTNYRQLAHAIKEHGKGHACKYCDAVFTRNSILNDHVRRSHLKEKNVNCTICNEKFFSQVQLREHTIKHTRERNHGCDLCGKKFLWRKNLVSHLASHNKK